MATTDFISGTTITADWLNDVDAFVYAGTVSVPVEIRTDSATSSVISYRTNASGQDFRAIRFEADASTSSGLYLGKSRGATIADYTILQTNDSLGRIIFGGANGTDMLSGASISASVDTGTPSATSMPGILKFNTTPDGSTTLTLRQTIDSVGNVAIGTSVPVAGRTFTINKDVTGATGSYGILNSGQVQSGVTSGYFAYSSNPTVVDASFTCGQIVHYHVTQGTFGASATVTYQYGMYIAPAMSGATYNIGIGTEVSISGSNNWNIYVAGTAPSFFFSPTYFADKFGYGQEASTGDTVTQSTNKSTNVTLHKVCGKVTMNAASLAAATTVSFNVSNNLVDATDVVIANVSSGGTVGAYTLTVSAVASGYFTLSLRNETAGSLSEAVAINFALIRAVHA
jgi:hypothetical protein